MNTNTNPVMVAHMYIRTTRVESSSTACAIAVTAPILKLPAYLPCSKPATDKAFLTLEMTFCKWTAILVPKNGPGVSPLSAVYAKITSIGHNSLPDLPKNTSTPFPN